MATGELSMFSVCRVRARAGHALPSKSSERAIFGVVMCRLGGLHGRPMLLSFFFPASTAGWEVGFVRDDL